VVPDLDIPWREGRIEPLPCDLEFSLGRFQTIGAASAPGRNRERRIDVPFPHDTLPRPVGGKHDPSDAAAFMKDAIVVFKFVAVDDGGGARAPSTKSKAAGVEC